MSNYEFGQFVGRVWRPDVAGPSIVVVRDGAVFDITSSAVPTMSALLALDVPSEYLASQSFEKLSRLEALFENSRRGLLNEKEIHLLSPCDLQAIKACGVTFASSMIERVIEEKAAGDPSKAQKIRSEVTAIIGDSLANLVAGSSEAEQVKRTLVDAGVWSQYLEVGIGPDAEVFTKSQVLSSVGWGAKVGLHPVSLWNNPEPEIVLAVDSNGRAKGATLGNDVNLRDVEGRSALLLGKAKDNNASCAIGPFIRLFDDPFTMDNIRSAEIDLTVKGEDGYILEGQSNMKEISRDPLDLIAQAAGSHHQYPDGFMLFLGTLFAPTQDRDVEGEGFTHKIGDLVTISNEILGSLENTVDYSHQCKPWRFGITDLMMNLSQRQML